MTEKDSWFDWMLYPTYTLIPENRQIIPEIYLPRNFKEILPLFYRQGRKEEIERYAEDLEEILKGSENEMRIRLNWSEKEGLRNISIGIQGGLDLEEIGIPHFQEHNLSQTNSLIAAAVATKYISELLKS